MAEAPYTIPSEANTPFPPSFQPDVNSTRAYLNRHQQRLQSKLYEIGPKTQERLNKANARIHRENEKIRRELISLEAKIAQVKSNPHLSHEKKIKLLQKLQKKIAKLRAKLKPPIPFFMITERLEKIVNDSSLSKKEKKERIERIRQEAGLSRREMRELFTGRLEKIYKTAKEELLRHRNVLLNGMQNQLREIERTKGSDSPEAASLRSEIQEIENVFKTHLNCLEANRSFYGSLYGGKSCIKRTFGAIGSAFKKIGSFFKKVISFSPIGLLSRVPLFRAFVAPILEVVNRVVDMCFRVIDVCRDIIKGVRDFFRNPLAMFKRALSFAANLIKRNWPLIAQLVFRFIPVVGQALAPIAETLLKAYTFTKTANRYVKQAFQNWIQRPTNWIHEKVNGLWERWVGSNI